MKSLKHIIFTSLLVASASSSYAQYNNSGISAGFFDSSEQSSINFSNFHLPPLAVLYENAKHTPRVLTLEKAQQLAEAEVAKQKRHIFSYLRANASYSYGRTDVWTASSSTFGALQQMNNGSDQVFWNIGVSLNLPLEDILDLKASVKRKRLEADEAQLKKDLEFDNLKREIAALFIKITNDLIRLKTASENAAIYQGAGALNQEDFHQGNMSIEDFAWTKTREDGAVTSYQSLQTQITTDIITLELLTHTPILTNTTTDITLENSTTKSEKQLRKENKAVEKNIRKTAEAEEKRYAKMEKADQLAQKKAAKEAAKAAKKKNK